MGDDITVGSAALANAYSSDQVAKGMEIELTYNVNKNWRVFATLTKQEVKQSNIAAPLTALVAGEVAY